MTKKILSLTLAFALVFTMGAGMISNVSAASSYTYTRTFTNTQNIHKTVSKFKINGMTGLCNNHAKESKAKGKAKIYAYKNSSETAHLAYWYGYKKGWTKGKYASLLSAAFNYTRNGKVYMTNKSTIKSMIKEASKHSVPYEFTAYKCVPTNNSQSFVAWKNRSVYPLTITAAYRLKKGETFPVYIYKNDKLIRTVTMNESRIVKTMLPEGTYKVYSPAEKNAAKRGPYMVSVKKSNTSSVKIENGIPMGKAKKLY